MGLQVPHMAATATFWQVVEKDVMALAVVLQHLKLCLPLPCPLAFFLLLFSLFSLRVSGHGGLTLGLFLLPFLLFLALVCLAMVGFTPSITAGGAGPCFLTGSSADLSGMRIFLDSICSPFLGVSFTGVPLASMPLGDAFWDRLC